MKKYYENNNYQHKKKLSMIINIINQKRKISLKINDEDCKDKSIYQLKYK